MKLIVRLLNHSSLDSGRGLDGIGNGADDTIIPERQLRHRQDKFFPLGHVLGPPYNIGSLLALATWAAVETAKEEDLLPGRYCIY